MGDLEAMGSVARLFRLHFSLWLGLLVLAAVAALTPAGFGWPLRLAAGWDAGVAAFLIVTFYHVFRARSQDAIRRRAAELDQVGALVLPLSMAAAVASVVVLVLAMVAGVEMGLKLSGIRLAGSGVQASMDYFAAHAAAGALRKAA